MTAAESHARCLWRLGLALFLLACKGCGPTFESSDQAVPWPLLKRDPAETGQCSGRWPAWRGTNGSGIAPGGRPPTRFSSTEGVRWKTAVPGRGNSSPVVWDDVVLLTTELEISDPPTLAVLCFDRSDGSPLWQAVAGKARGRTHVKNGYASASVTTDGQRIFAFFGATGLFCYDLSGDCLWRAELGDLDHQYGTASSPVLYDEMVIQLCDSAEDSYLAAFDKASGHRIWETPRPSRGGWSTPVLVEVEAEGNTHPELVVNGTQGETAAKRLVIAYDPQDGRELWRVRGTSRLVSPTPLVGGGLVYCISGRNGPIMAIRPGGQGDVTQTHVVWKATRGGPYIPSGVVYRNRLFVLTDAGKVTCYNAGDGATIWSTKLRGPCTASLVAADGRIYAVNEHGIVYVFAAADSFQLLAENDMQARCLATPAVANGDLLIRTEGMLYCLAGEPTSSDSADAPAEPAESPPGRAAAASSASPVQPKSAPTGPATTPEAAGDGGPSEHWPGRSDAWPFFRGDPQATGVARSRLPDKLEPLWTFSVEKGGFQSTAAIAEGTVYVGCLDGKLYAVDLASGRQRWEFPTELGFTASAAVRAEGVFIGDSDGRFYCIHAKTGKPKWDFPTEAEINSSANFYRDRVLFGSQDGMLYCLKADSGEPAWAYESQDMIQCSPAVADGRVFVAGCDARLHVVDAEKGTRVAHVDIEAPTLCTPAVRGRMALMGTTGNAFFGVDWQAANVVWRCPIPGELRSSAAVTAEAAIVGSRDKRVYAIDIRRGEQRWTFTTKGRVDSSPVVVGSRVFVGSADGRLYALDVSSGRELWHFETGGSILASPAVADGRLVIGTDDGDLYCFGTKRDSKR